MLKGISSLLSPELLQILAEMGHGDELVIGDANFPSCSLGRRVVHAQGHGTVQMLDAVLSLLPLDDFVQAPVSLMQVVPGTLPAGEPLIWADIRQQIQVHEGEKQIETLERFQFYERAKAAYAVIQTGERALYASVILKKGVLREE